MKLPQVCFLIAFCLLWMGAHTVFAQQEKQEMPADLTIPVELPDPAELGPYLVGWTAVEVSRPDQTTFEAWLFYPATASGEGQPYDGSGAPYPAITFAHGFLSPPLLYQGNYEHLASWGYFVIAPGSALELFPSHLVFADDLGYTLDYLEAKNGDSNSQLYQQVDVAHFGASGHSMGGGVSILATAQDVRIKALINLAAANTWPDSAIEATADIHVPIAIVGGTDDWLVPVETQQQPMYDNGNAPRLLPVFIGGDHCAFASELGNCGGEMPAETQLYLTNRWLTAFFNLYLKEEPVYAWYIWGPIMHFDPQIETQTDAGFALTPAFGFQFGLPTQTVTHSLTVTNTGEESASFSLELYGMEWNHTISPDATPVLEVGESATVMVEVEIPAVPATTKDSVWVVAVAEDGLTMQVGIVRTQTVAP